MQEISRSRSPSRHTLVAIAVAGALSCAYGSSYAAGGPAAANGVVAGSYYTPSTGTKLGGSVASYYAGAKVCFDANDNGACDKDEVSDITDGKGSFHLVSPHKNTGPLIAEIGTGATNDGHPVTERVVLRAAQDRKSPAHVVISPLSTEVARMMGEDGASFQGAQERLAQRLNVSPKDVLDDPAKVHDASDREAIVTESTILANRFETATKIFDRHDAATLQKAQDEAMNIEGIPRYDHVFVIMLENKSTSSIKNSKFAPKINAYLNAGNQFTSYYSTGNPSEPNRLAVSAADDFGVTDDSSWACVPEGDTADLPEDALPAGMNPCTNATNHNFKNKPNLFSALSANGMSWRVYNESMNPGRDWRQSSVADKTIVGQDHVYAADSPLGAVGNPDLMVTMPGSLYATKHNGSVNFQEVRSSAEFTAYNRTMGGGQWDEALQKSPNTPKGWNVDEFSKDLATSNVGQLNILEPDQCDDMHGVTATGTLNGETVAASDCSGSGLIARGDNYTDYLIKKIEASPLWNNPEKRVAIVMMFDEGSATTGFNSCCGWNPSAGSSIAGKSLGALTQNADGTVSVENIARYNMGNKGHGTSVNGILTNQPNAPKGVVDSDAYSHLSFVRTLQNMFGLADPGDDWSYMNRSKYTEGFIQANITYLPEYAGSADPHFDAVRPMNHAYVIPADYVQKNGFPTPQVGPDADQRNAWAVK